MLQIAYSARWHLVSFSSSMAHYPLQNKMMAGLQKRNAQIDWDYVFPNDGTHLCRMVAPFLYVLKRAVTVFNILSALFYSAINFPLVNETPGQRNMEPAKLNICWENTSVQASLFSATCWLSLCPCVIHTFAKCLVFFLVHWRHTKLA